MDQSDKKYSGALPLLPIRLRSRAGLLGLLDQAQAEEIRLRVGFPMSVVIRDGEESLGGDPITQRDLDAVVEIATGASLHSSRETIKAGFINAPGGYRLGLCGASATEQGVITGFRNLSSIALRIPREAFGIGEKVLAATGGTLDSTLIISPPGGGKTTLLRDLVRLASEGSEQWGLLPSRVSLADERGEVAAVTNGKAQMDVGRRTDIISACPKAQAVMILLRVMNPKIIALDEITDPEDIVAIERAANCGVNIFATAHSGSVAELMRKPMYKAMLDGLIFKTIVTIHHRGGIRDYEVTGVNQESDEF